MKKPWRIAIFLWNKAYNRIKSLKEKFNLADRLPVDVSVATKTVGSEANKYVALEVAQVALYMTDPKGLIPLKTGASVSVVRLAVENVDEIIKISEGIDSNYANAFNDFVIEMKKAGFRVTEYSYDEKLPEDVPVIVVSENYPLPEKSLDLEEQRKRLRSIQESTTTSVINVALKYPYDANMVSPDVYICAIGSNI